MSSKRKKLHKKLNPHQDSRKFSDEEISPCNRLARLGINANYGYFYYDIPIDDLQKRVAESAIQMVLDLPFFASFSKVTPLHELAKITSTNALGLENPRDSFLTSIDKFLADRYADALHLSSVIPGKEMLQGLNKEFFKVQQSLKGMSDSELTYLRTFLMDGMVLTDAITAATGLAILDQRDQVHA
jgi:hypothetical protein